MLFGYSWLHVIAYKYAAQLTILVTMYKDA